MLECLWSTIHSTIHMCGIPRPAKNSSSHTFDKNETTQLFVCVRVCVHLCVCKRTRKTVRVQCIFIWAVVVANKCK